jgi:hypothetical protein
MIDNDDERREHVMAHAPPAVVTGPAVIYGPDGEAWSDKLYVADLAKVARVKPQTIIQYHWDAERRLRAGESRPRDLPQPTGYTPNPKGGPPKPWWSPAAAAAWLAVRQPSGHPRADGGKPRRLKTDRQKTGPKPRQDAA